MKTMHFWFRYTRVSRCQPCIYAIRRKRLHDPLSRSNASHDTFRPSLLFLTPLLPDGTLVESQLFALEDVSITATALTGPAGDDGVQTTSLELPLQRRLDLSTSSVPLGLLGLDTLALLLLLLLTTTLPASADGLAVVCLEVLSEGRGIDLNHGGAGQGVCADELVVGRVEGDGDDTGLAADALGTPGEVATVEAQRAELAVAAACAHEMDALAADSRVGRLTTFLECSVGPLVKNGSFLTRGVEMPFGLCIPLLAIGCALGTGGATLVT